jgi:hypothetical protein
MPLFQILSDGRFSRTLFRRTGPHAILSANVGVSVMLEFKKRRHRRAARFTQTEIVRMMRAAKQVGDDHTVRVDPDGAMTIVKLTGQGTPAAKAEPEHGFARGLGIVP